MSSHRRSSIIALLATTVLALSACTAAPNPAPSPSKQSSAPAPTLGDSGYGALQLGMTKAEATATGLTTGISGTDGSCGAASDGRLAGAPAAASESTYVRGPLFFSSNTGKLVAIYAYGPVATPKGIKVGSTVAELKAAYPTWSAEPDDAGNASDSGRGYVELPGGKASYRIVVDSGSVVELSLDSEAQDCYE